MTIEQIVLKVLKKYKGTMSGLAGSVDVIWANDVKKIAKSISDKIKTLNEEEVEKILNKEIDFDVFREEIIFGDSVDKICNLAVEEGDK